MLKKSFIVIIMLGFIAYAQQDENVSSVSNPATKLENKTLKLKPGEKLAKEQIFTYNAGSAPASLDPQRIEGTVEGHFARNLFETLVITDENDKIIPGAASSWEHSDDYKTWTFHLRKDGKFSNGEPVKASDFVFAWRRLVDPKTASPYASYLDYMKLANALKITKGQANPKSLGVEAKDDYTLVLHLENPVPFADILTEFYVLSPVPQKLVEKLGDDWSKSENIVGNGAFKMESMVLNEKAILKRNPYYWDNKNNHLDTLVLLQISDESAAFDRYRAGDLDVGGFPLELLDKVKKEYPKELTSPIETFCTYYYEYNVLKPPFDNLKVRQALSLALDRNIITDKILRTGQKPAYTFTPPTMNRAEAIKNPDWVNWSASQRYAEAVKLLKEAGYDKSKPLNFTLLYNTSEGHKKIALAAVSIWKKNLGGIVNVKLENQEWKTFLSERHLLKHQIARAGWCSDYNEASSFLNTLTSSSSNNTTGFKNAQYDKIIDEAYTAKDDEQRAELYANAEKILFENAPILPVYFYTGQALIKPYVRGYKIKPSSSYYFKDIYILEH